MSKYFSQFIVYAFTLFILLLNTQFIVAKPLHKAHCSMQTKKMSVFTMEPLLLEVELNQRQLPGITQCYVDKLGQLWVSKSDLLRWGLLLPRHTATHYNQQSYYQLNWYPYLTYQLD